MGAFRLPADHEPGMRVPKGGSSCANCRYLGEDRKTCRSPHFVEWNDGPDLPAQADSYCSDWWRQGSEPDLDQDDIAEAFARTLARWK